MYVNFDGVELCSKNINKKNNHKIFKIILEALLLFIIKAELYREVARFVM